MILKSDIQKILHLSTTWYPMESEKAQEMIILQFPGVMLVCTVLTQ